LVRHHEQLPAQLGVARRLLVDRHACIRKLRAGRGQVGGGGRRFGQQQRVLELAPGNRGLRLGLELAGFIERLASVAARVGAARSRSAANAVTLAADRASARWIFL
jgi:hypothetical protein